MLRNLWHSAGPLVTTLIFGHSHNSSKLLWARQIRRWLVGHDGAEALTGHVTKFAIAPKNETVLNYHNLVSIYPVSFRALRMNGTNVVMVGVRMKAFEPVFHLRNTNLLQNEGMWISPLITPGYLLRDLVKIPNHDPTFDHATGMLQNNKKLGRE